MDVELDFELSTGDDSARKGDPTPVRVVASDVQASQDAADFQSWSSWWTGSLQGPVQILPQTKKRHRATITIQAGEDPYNQNTFTTQASGVNAPITAGANGSPGKIVTITGFRVNGISSTLGGTVNLTDINAIENFSYPIQTPAGAVPFDTGLVTLPTPVSSTTGQALLLALPALGAGSTGVTLTVYGAVASANPPMVTLGNSRESIQNNGGADYQAGITIISEAENAVWLIGDGVNDLLVSVEDERFK